MSPFIYVNQALGPSEIWCFHGPVAGWKIHPKISDLPQLFIAPASFKKTNEAWKALFTGPQSLSHQRQG